MYQLRMPGRARRQQHENTKHQTTACRPPARLETTATEPQMMAAAGWLVTMSEDKAKARCLEELRDVKAHIKNQFERQVSWLVGEKHYTPANAEKEAFEHALSRMKSWEAGY